MPASSRRPAGEYPDLRAVAAVALRGWWAIALGAVVVAALAHAASSRGPVQYEARARVLVGPVNGAIGLLRGAAQRAPTYANLATSRRVMVATGARLGLRAAPDRLAREVKAEVDGGRLIVITVDGTNPRRAAGLANAVATAMGPAILGDRQKAAAEFRLVDPAVVPRAPLATHRRALTIFAGLTGALVALTLLLLLDYFRGRLTRADDLEELAGAPLLAVLDPRTPGGGYDVLAARIALAARRTVMQTILVAGDGAEDVAERLGRAMEAGGTPVARLTAPAAPAEARRALRRKYDPRILVVAAPAPDRFASAVTCARFVDSTILVARQGRTPRDSVAQWAAALRQVGGTVLGTALCARRRPLGALGARLVAAVRRPRRPGVAEAA
jgi:capsular polysaccharide biosynthesis protein